MNNKGLEKTLRTQGLQWQSCKQGTVSVGARPDKGETNSTVEGLSRGHPLNLGNTKPKGKQQCNELGVSETKWRTTATKEKNKNKTKNT